MIKVTEPAMLASLDDGNRFIGETPEMVNSSITFSGKNFRIKANTSKASHKALKYHKWGAMTPP